MKEAEKRKPWGTRLDYDPAASRWREEVEEARSIANGTHPKLVGLEAEDLEKRKEKFEGAPLGNLMYERVDRTFKFIINHVSSVCLGYPPDS